MNAAADWLFVGAALLFAGLALGWITQRPVFTLRAIQIEGDVGRSSVAAIRTHALPQLAGNFFSIDLGQASAAFETVPWVRRAVVRRVWPDRLAVRLEEHEAAAWWQLDDGQDKLVNRHGEVFEANPGDVEDENLPALRGPEGSAAALLAMHGRLQPLLAPLGLRVVTLAMSPRGSWRAGLEGGGEIEFGRGSDAEVLARAEAFAGSVGEVIGRYRRPLEYADLRHAGGYALRLQGIGTVAPETSKN